ncbi:MAG: mannosyltransferase family protein [Chloroflexia bacterium]
MTARPAAEDKTRQLPQVNGTSGDSGAADAQEVKSPAQPGPVPQETVPMPIPAWPVVEAVDEAPSKPPPLRGTEKERYSPSPGPGSTTRQPWLAQRTGLLTSELRRALPPWALPLLDSQPVSVWLGARIAITVLAFVAGLMLPGLDPKGTANWYGSPGGPILTGVVDRLGGVWTRWDGQWYLKIATEGYHRDDGSAAFFPLYPWLVSGTGWLAAERYIWAGILLSSLFFLAALILLHRLVRLDFHPADAGRTTFYLAAFPMAFFFWAVYSESLFLFLSVGALLAARTQRWWWAATCIALAIWTRTTGLLLLLPLGWEVWKAYHPDIPTNPNAMPPARPHRLTPYAFILPIFALVLLLGWSWINFGNPLASLSAQTEWNRHFSWPWQTIVSAFQAATTMPFRFQPEDQSWTYLGALLLALVLGALSIRWLRGSYSLYLWAGIIFPLFSATPHNPLLSYPRFLAVLFPAFIVLALIGRNRYAHQIILWTSLLLLGLYTIRFANWYWVA